MNRHTIAWLGPLTLATVILVGSVYIRFSSNRLSAEPPTEASPPGEEVSGATAERAGNGPAPAASTLPERLPAVDDLSKWARTSDAEHPSWKLRWESDAQRAARVLAYLSSNSQVIDFSLTAGSGDGWVIEAVVEGADDRISERIPDREVEAQLARLLQGSMEDSPETTGGRELEDTESLSEGPVHDILSGGSGSVRFSRGDTYRWVRRQDVLSLELSP